MMSEMDVTLYLGGTRSGKSAHAEARILRYGGPALYVATAEIRPDDPSMLERLERHRARRPAHWHTLECPLQLADTVGVELARLRTFFAAAETGQPEASEETGPTVLLDCVTLWVSNILFSMPDPEDLAAFEKAVRAEVEALLCLIERTKGRWVVVSGETGLGGIGATLLGRNYCDGLGLANQLIAARAREAFLVVAGRLLCLSQ